MCQQTIDSSFRHPYNSLCGSSRIRIRKALVKESASTNRSDFLLDVSGLLLHGNVTGGRQGAVALVAILYSCQR